MKNAFAIALVLLTAPAAWADGPAPSRDDPAPAASPEAKAEAQAAPKTAVAPLASPGNFCGQAQVQAWFLNTDVGLQLQRERQAELKQAMSGPKVEAEKQIAVPEAAAPQAIAPQAAAPQAK